MIEQPAQIEQALIDYIFIDTALVFKNYRAVVFIDTDAIHSTIGNWILAAQETHTEKGLHVLFDASLQITL